MKIANSIWFRDDGSLKVNPGFLQVNADYYDAAAYLAPFNGQTLIDINRWVSKNTGGMIDEALDQLDSDLVLCLVNAVVFDAKWETKYANEDIKEDKFYAYDGTVQTVEMMSSEENHYLEDGMATGFIKDYKDGQYSFVAMLPNEGISIDNYIASLTGEGLILTLKNAKNSSVDVKIPKFSGNDLIKMDDALKALGMPTAFDAQNADFSNLGTSTVGNLYIGEVQQNTHIEVDENGTKAAAVTFGYIHTTEVKRIVTLDRPFVYVIVDNATNLPIFIGTMLSVG